MTGLVDRPTRPGRQAAETAQRPDPEAWALALELAGGNVRRLTCSKDGRTVIVANR
jgi:hypothetical protein